MLYSEIQPLFLHSIPHDDSPLPFNNMLCAVHNAIEISCSMHVKFYCTNAKENVKAEEKMSKFPPTN
jgi:hypothetical protein